MLTQAQQVSLIKRLTVLATQYSQLSQELHIDPCLKGYYQGKAVTFELVAGWIENCKTI